jgi:hypothetical protein
MILGKDKEKVAGLIARAAYLKTQHGALALAIKREAVAAKQYLETHGKSQARKLESMILFCQNLITICERSEKEVAK